MIRFTIITCVYNASSVFDRTAESVLAQTYQDVEHIIIDGVSKDDTLNKAVEYKNKSDKDGNNHSVVIVSEPDRGLYDAMNKGIDKATGDFLVFLNAGDILPSADTLSNIASCVKSNEPLPAVLYGDTDVVDDNGNFLHHRRLCPPKHLTWRSFKHGMLVCHQAFYARTDIAKQTHYDLSYRLSADVDWCIRIMKYAECHNLTLLNVNMVVVNYLEGGMSVQNHKASLKERFHLMSHHYGFVSTSLMHLWFVVRAVFK